MKNKNKSVLYLHTAVMLFGLSSVIGRNIGVQAILVAGGRVLCSSFLLLCLTLVMKKPLNLECKKDYGIMAITGIVLALHWTAFFQSAQTASVAVATITFSAFPLFLVFLEPIIFKEKVHGYYLVGAGILLLGVVVMMPEFSLDNQMTIGIVWGMISSFAYAVMTLLNRKLSQKYEAGTICFYEQGMAAIVLLPAFMIIEVRWTPISIGGIVLLGSVCTALAHSLYVSAQKVVSAQTAGMISGMESVYGIFYAWLFLGEIPRVREWIGGMIVLSVAFSFSTRRLKK